jgi:ABC-type transport system involved in multi-copper enzyme maturation permease subunit
MALHKDLWKFQSKYKSIVVISCLLIILAVGFLPLFSVLNDGAFIVFGAFPLVAGWLLGLGGGVLYCALQCLLIAILANIAGKTPAEIYSMGIITYALYLILAAGMGRMSDLTRRVQKELEERIRIENELQHYKEMLENRIETLSGLLPICAKCKKIRDDTGYWSQVEDYISKNTEAKFSHSICPDCATELYPDIVDKVYKK